MSSLTKKTREKLHWPSPKRRSLAASSDLRLFFEAMMFINKFELVSKKQIKDQLSSRVKGLKLIKKLSDTGIENLIKELKFFGWILADRPGVIERSEKGLYRMSEAGIKALEVYSSNRRKFLILLINKMHKQYVIPGWFIDRLWKLNPKGQGQIIIPAPLKKWNPISRIWENNNWNTELTEQVLNSYNLIKKIDQNSFNVPIDIWLDRVQKSWGRLSNMNTRKDIKTQKYAPRNRLTIAMKEAAIDLLFNNTLLDSTKKDFRSTKTPLAPRTYMAWCPRLEELELIFYSDYNPSVPGRIIVPVSVFKKPDESESYEYIGIKNLNDEILALHRPKWKEFRKIFMETLYRVYQERLLKNKSLYVSIQNVRDEVCRQLRISSSSFEDFLSSLIKESLTKFNTLTISIETDVREDQKQGHQLERRPVNINGKFCSLIAINKQLKKNL